MCGGSGIRVSPVADTEEAPHADNRASGFVSLNIILLQILDDFSLLSWAMLEGLLCLRVCPLSSRA